MIWPALLLIVVAAALVRLGWGGPRGAAAAGWALATAGLIWLALDDGAWGLAVGMVTGMAAVFALLLHAGWMSPARIRRPARKTPSVVLPHRWPDLAHRFAVFLLVVPCAFAAAQWLAFGAQAVARHTGIGDADATVLAFFLQPIVWMAIMSWQMMMSGAVKMIAPPVAAMVLGTLLWSLS